MKHQLWIIALLAASPTLADEGDYSRLKLMHTLKGHEATIRDISISPDGKTLASGGHDRTIRLWDISTGKVRAVLRGHQAPVRVLRFSPDGEILASGAYGGDKDVVRLWDVASGKQKEPVTATKTGTRVLAFSPDGKTLAWDDKTTIRLCNIATGKETATLPAAGVVKEIVFSPDGRTLASSFHHGQGFQVWSAEGKEICAAKGKFATIRFSSDSQIFKAGGFREIAKWDVATGQESETVSGAKSPAPRFVLAQLSPDGKALATLVKDSAVINFRGDTAAFGEQRCRLFLMDASSGEEQLLFETRGKENWFRKVIHSPDGKTLALEEVERKAWILVDAVSGERQARLTAPEEQRKGGYPRISFAPNGKTVACSRGVTIELWQVW